MKIVFTISDFGAAANIGGDTERRSFVVEIPDTEIPAKVKDHVKDKDAKWQTLSLSVLEEIN